jgi:serpin B
MSKAAKFIPLILIFAFLLNCGDSCVSPPCDQPRRLTLAETQLVDSYNRFGLKIFRELVDQGSPDANVFISPLSISMALGMTLNGAAGGTEQAMKATLEFDGTDLQQIDECYRSVIDLLIDLDPDVIFEIANSIWYRPELDPEQDFLDLCQTYFDSEVTDIDFSRPDAADIINAWVSEKTHERIEEIIQGPISPLTVMFLINAIYFLGTWTYQFDPALTQDDWFTLPDGTKTPCEMMMQPGPDDLSRYDYLETEEFQAVDLPYANGLFSMSVILPRPGVELDTLIDGIDQETWNAWTSGFNPIEGRIQLPKFEIGYYEKLNDVLKSLGMGIAFSEWADFTGIQKDGGLLISQVLHKTYVKVDEAGTEAAAVTLVEIGRTSVPDTFEMRVDRPFLFAIREHHSGTVLFIGKMVDPNQ